MAESGSIVTIAIRAADDKRRHKKLRHQMELFILYLRHKKELLPYYQKRWHAEKELRRFEQKSGAAAAFAADSISSVAAPGLP